MALLEICGQCYDGSSAMSGIKSGVVVRVQAAEPKAVFTHCYGHDLACAASIWQDKLMRDALDTNCEITKLIKEIPTSRCNLQAVEARTWQVIILETVFSVQVDGQ